MGLRAKEGGSTVCAPAGPGALQPGAMTPRPIDPRPTLRAAVGALALSLGACAGEGANRAPPVAEALDPAAPACRAGHAGTGVVVGSGVPGDPALPEPSSGFRLGLKPATGRTFMVATAHPLATAAGCRVLAAGGSAADAAVAVQAVLGLVEPQSSGLGGGAFVLHYDAATQTVASYDGRETAPAAAMPNDLRWIDETQRTPPLPDVRASGRSIGTPGAVHLLALLHADHGRLPWAGLFDTAIRHATDGFAIGGRLADAIRAAQVQLLRDPDAAAYFLNADLSPRAPGSRLRNPAYADTLHRIASGGAQAFYSGAIAADIVAEIGRTQAGPGAPGPMTPGLTTLADLAAYRAVRRAPVCLDYRAHRVCGMGPPSSGGIAVAQILGMLEHVDLPALAPAAVDADGGRPDPRAVHLISEAMRLAFADRNRYLADTDFVPLPGHRVAGLLDRDYLRGRAALIRPETSLGVAPAGRFPGAGPAGSSVREGQGTSHVSIVDARGNAVAMTTTIESSMGSYRFVRGFLLNNQLTDFAFEPVDADGPIANRLGPLKRPRSSMAPTLVFERRADGQPGELHLVTGSPGGAAIIAFVTKTLVGLLDWGLDAQQAAALVNFGAVNHPTTFLGGEHPGIDVHEQGRHDALAQALRERGHAVSVQALSSGVATLRRLPPGGPHRWQAGVDPRREGLALGD